MVVTCRCELIHHSRSSRLLSKADSETVVGSMVPIGEASREQASYWSLNLLLLTWSETSKGRVPWFLDEISYAIYSISPFLDRESSWSRAAALCLPALIGRCRTSLITSQVHRFAGTPHSQGVLPDLWNHMQILYHWLSTMQSSRRGIDICATQAARAPTMARVAMGGSPGITV